MTTSSTTRPATATRRSARARFVLTATEFYWPGSIAPSVRWSPVGGTLTVLDPDPGNQVIAGTIFSSAPGSNCTAWVRRGRLPRPDRRAHPGPDHLQDGEHHHRRARRRRGYTVTVINTGQTPYTGARLTDSLSGLLDDAVYNANAVATSGTLGYASPVLSWTGDLAVGQPVTITYSVTVRNPDPGDKAMVNSGHLRRGGQHLPAAHTDASCRSSVDVLTPALTIVKTADLDNTTLGSTVTYTVTVTNSGQTPYAAAAFSDSLAGVLDDATYNAGATTATRGTTSYAAGVLGWSGALTRRPVGDDHLHGHRQQPGHRRPQPAATPSCRRRPGTTAPPASTDTRCTAVVPVTNSVTLTFTKTADVDDHRRQRRGELHRHRDNSSAVSRSSAANFTDPLAEILDDATYNDDAAGQHRHRRRHRAATSSGPGPSPPGPPSPCTYSVTVHTAITGNQILSGTVSSTSVPGSDNCLAGSTDPGAPTPSRSPGWT